VQAVFFKIVVHIQVVINHRHAPVGDNGQNEGDIVVGNRRKERFANGGGIARKRR
jgi:hypothetical protein